MDFSMEQISNMQTTLPQFSELTYRSSPNTAVSVEYSSGESMPSQTAKTYMIATDSNQKQILINSPTKYTTPLLTWSDSNALIQLCEKQGIQAINIPTYCQNNTIFGVQANTLPASIVPSMYLPSTSQGEIVKQEVNIQFEEQRNADMETQTQLQQQQTAALAEYFQKLQATNLPFTLQQLIKLQSLLPNEQLRKEKIEIVKAEQPQNSILNIPSVSVFRNTQLQNNNLLMDQMIMGINPDDLNVHLENEEENENNLQPVAKAEQLVQIDSPKIEKKPKFRAKIGEIKVSVTLDGSMLYCCPECSLAFSNKADIEQHIQAHIQERKYECQLCGAMLKRKEHLDQHMRGHSDARPFKCNVCEKAFKRNEHLTRHFVIHSGNKNFTCSVCQKAFSRKDHLNKHTQTHSGIRKTRVKKDIYYVDQKDSFDRSADISVMPKQEISYFLKNGSLLKQETTLLQHSALLQTLQKDPNLLHTFTSFKEQAMKDINVLQQQNVNTNEILPQNTRYLMPS